MAKRGMKRGSVCLTPSELKILQQMDKAIERMRKVGVKKARARAK